jgi:hypothetical protein
MALRVALAPDTRKRPKELVSVRPFDGSTGFDKSQSLIVAESLARWPCDPRTWFPGPSRGSLLEPVWRFTPAPSGKKKCTARCVTAARRLSTNLEDHGPDLSPNFAVVWTTCGYTPSGGVGMGRWLTRIMAALQEPG